MTGWAQIWMDAQALLAREAMETQVALALACAIVAIMFFEGVWTVFRLPRRAVFSFLRRPLVSRFEETAAALADPPGPEASAPRPGRSFAGGVGPKEARVRIVKNRRIKRVNRRRFKPTKPGILRNTRIEPWLLGEPEPEPLAPLKHPDAV